MNTINTNSDTPVPRTALFAGLLAMSIFIGICFALINVFGASTFVAYLEGAAFICM